MSETKQSERPWWLDDPWRGNHLFEENRNKYPGEELLAKYNRKFVAWYPDGSGICDSDEDRVALWNRLKTSVEVPEMYHIEYITDETYI
jgi:hypothetical protein